MIDLQDIFNRYNADCFKDALPLILIEVGNFPEGSGVHDSDARGMINFDTDPPTIHVANWLFNPERPHQIANEIEKVVLHEMIHLKLGTTEENENHGPVFKEECKRVAPLIGMRTFVADPKHWPLFG